MQGGGKSMMANSVGPAELERTTLNPYMLYCMDCGSISDYHGIDPDKLKHYYCPECQNPRRGGMHLNLNEHKEPEPTPEMEQKRKQEREERDRIEGIAEDTAGRAIVYSKKEIMDIMILQMINDHNDKRRETRQKYKEENSNPMQGLAERTFNERHMNEAATMKNVAEKAF